MNAIIMAAGMSSRFVPLSWECPKALLEVNQTAQGGWSNRYYSCYWLHG